MTFVMGGLSNVHWFHRPVTTILEIRHSIGNKTGNQPCELEKPARRIEIVVINERSI